MYFHKETAVQNWWLSLEDQSQCMYSFLFPQHPCSLDVYLWLGFFSFLLLTVFSSSSQSHILTNSANRNPTHQNPSMQSHVLIPGSAHCWTLLPSTEPPRFMPGEAVVPSVMIPTLHSCPTCVYPITQTTDAPACMHTHIPTSGDHKLTVITP